MRTKGTIVSGACILATTGWLIAGVSDAEPKKQPSAETAPSATDGNADAKPAEKSVKRTWSKNVADWQALKEHQAADNSSCLDCHAEYEEEKLTLKHVDIGVGCATCHGVSKKHLDDEDCETAPDVMFVKEAIITFCMECHPVEQLSEKKQHLKLLAKEGVLKNKTCVNCHGKRHNIRHRMITWDKTTGKLMEDAAESSGD
jgi:hypothetical protein